MCEPAILLSLLWPLLSSSHNQGLAYSWGPGQYGPWRPCCLRVSPTGVARLVVAGSQWSEAVKNLARWFARVPRVSPLADAPMSFQCSSCLFEALSQVLQESSMPLFNTLLIKPKTSPSVPVQNRIHTSTSVCHPLIMSDDYCIVLPVNQKSEHLVPFPQRWLTNTSQNRSTMRQRERLLLHRSDLFEATKTHFSLRKSSTYHLYIKFIS